MKIYTFNPEDAAFRFLLCDPKHKPGCSNRHRGWLHRSRVPVWAAVITAAVGLVFGLLTGVAINPLLVSYL